LSISTNFRSISSIFLRQSAISIEAVSRQQSAFGSRPPIVRVTKPGTKIMKQDLTQFSSTGE
jgi:hypothetical protein